MSTTKVVKKAIKKTVKKSPDAPKAKKASVCNYEKNLRASKEDLKSELVAGQVKQARKKGELELSELEMALIEQNASLAEARQQSDVSLADRAKARISMEKTSRKLSLAQEEFDYQFN